MAFPPVLPPVLSNETGKRLIFQIDYDVIRRSGQHGLLGHVERVGFNVVNMGGDEEEVPWTGVYVLFKILAKINAHPPFQYISGGFSLAVMVWRPLLVGGGSNQTQPNFGSPGFPAEAEPPPPLAVPAATDSAAHTPTGRRARA